MLACSTLSSFAFHNGTSVPATVTYELRNPLRNPPSSFETPALAEALGRRTEWRALSASEYQLSGDRRTVTVTVPPGEALRLAEVMNFEGHNLQGLDAFPVLKITVSEGETPSSVTIEDARALLAFEKRSGGLYVFEAREMAP